jgi:hypothetical protein
VQVDRSVRSDAPNSDSPWPSQLRERHDVPAVPHVHAPSRQWCWIRHAVDDQRGARVATAGSSHRDHVPCLATHHPLLEADGSEIVPRRKPVPRCHAGIVEIELVVPAVLPPHRRAGDLNRPKMGSSASDDRLGSADHGGPPPTRRAHGGPPDGSSRRPRLFQHVPHRTTCCRRRRRCGRRAGAWGPAFPEPPFGVYDIHTNRLVDPSPVTATRATQRQTVARRPAQRDFGNLERQLPRQWAPDIGRPSNQQHGDLAHLKRVRPCMRERVRKRERERERCAGVMSAQRQNLLAPLSTSGVGLRSRSTASGQAGARHSVGRPGFVRRGARRGVQGMSTGWGRGSVGVSVDG